MMFVASKCNASCLLLIVLAGFTQQTAAESFMEIWLSQLQSPNGDDWLSQQVASELQAELPATSAFDQDEWLARQQAKSEDARQEDPQPDSENGGGALSQQAWTPAGSWEADSNLEQTLLSDVEKALGKEHRRGLEQRIGSLEEKMAPMFQALPKNEYGKLAHPSVRYMLHRFFVEQHGWFIDGLFTEGAAMNKTSPSRALKDRVPMFVEGLFEKRLSGRGFNIRDMAVLVAVVEDSIQQEAQEGLKKVYAALDQPLDREFNKAQAELLIEVYMGGFVMNTNMSSTSAHDLYQQTSAMQDFYPTWKKAQEFFANVRESRFPDQESYSFGELSVVVKELVDTFGTFHGKQCSGLKDTLTGLEKAGSSGCVGLSDFYAKGLKADTNWLFIESPDYLRDIGVLDETNPQSPQLLSANYINSPTNCLQPTGYYMVCCHNECDGILGGLERTLGQPTASPLEITAALRSSSGSLRGGAVAPSLRRRLQEIADYHGGRVPLHGRLFAQWLHHVFPHECPYPYISGKKHPQWVEDFEEDTGKASQLTDLEMSSFVINASRTHAVQSIKTLSADVGSCAPWQKEEELFAPIPHGVPLHALEEDPHVWNFASGLAFIAAASAFFVSLLRTFKSMSKLRLQPKMLHI